MNYRSSDTRAPYGELVEYIHGLKIIDSHEHISSNENRRLQTPDVISEYLTHYTGSDLVSAGMPVSDLQLCHSQELSVSEKWGIIKSWWEICRDGGYFRSLDITAHRLYGIERIDKNTIERLNSAFLAKRESGGCWKHVIEDVSNIEKLITDSDLEADRQVIHSTVNLDRFIYPENRNVLWQIEAESGLKIRSMEDWIQAAENAFYQAVQRGAVTVKSTLAYKRSLNYRRSTRSEAEASFLPFFDHQHYPPWEQPVIQTGKAFQDYMMFHILGLAEKASLPIQFHTGIQEGFGNLLVNSRPELLNELFISFPRLKFVIFHAGYPWWREAGNLAKMFPNVHVDMCWTHIISPAASRQMLYEWLQMMPVNKINGFGGDYAFVDGIVGHQHMARDNIAGSLATMIDESIIDEKRARYIARRLLHDNADELYFRRTNDH